MSIPRPSKKIKLDEEGTSNYPGPSGLSYLLKKSENNISEEKTFQGESSDEDLSGDSSDEDLSEEDTKTKTKWTFLQHEGPVFPPPYIPLPDHVRFFYDGEPVRLSSKAEEVAGFYAKMLYHEYTSKKIFDDNFFIDWRKVMTSDEKELIQNLPTCDFKEMHAYLNKKLTKAQKAENKAKKENIQLKYGFCNVNGMNAEIRNFKITPPGLFKGRGEHPEMGRLRERVNPENVVINCSQDNIPKPPEGHEWKEVKHDATVQWLASWEENINNQLKYVSIKETANENKQKFERARKLYKCIDKIRKKYLIHLDSKEMIDRQCAVATYFIDRLSLRAGNVKDITTKADTVGCCTLRCEHITLHKEKDSKENVVVLNFLGKDSVQYYKEMTVEESVYKNLEEFMKNKNDEDSLFDKLTTCKLNKYLNDMMPGLTAKVFRTYNASITLERQLNDLIARYRGSYKLKKIKIYKEANKAVAILCNHKRTKAKAKSKINPSKGQTKITQFFSVIRGNLRATTNGDENQTIPSLYSSILYYSDPRITVSWCNKHNVPIEDIFTKHQRIKFQWAIDEIRSSTDYQF